MSIDRLNHVAILGFVLLITGCSGAPSNQPTPTLGLPVADAPSPAETLNPSQQPTLSTPTARLTETASSQATLAAAETMEAATQWSQFNATGTGFVASTTTAQAYLTATVDAPRVADAHEGALNQDGTFPLAWPPPPVTDDQLAEARRCQIRQRSHVTYPASLTLEDLSREAPIHACGWAWLTGAYADRLNQGAPLTPDALRAYYTAFVINPAFTYAEPIFSGYFGKVPLMEPPPIAQQPVEQIVIEYFVGSSGSPRGHHYLILITDAGTSPVVSGYHAVGSDFAGAASGHPVAMGSETFHAALDVQMVQTLRGGLDNLLPIDATPFWVYSGCEGQPESRWEVLLVFANGDSIKLSSYEQLTLSGGPLYMTIDEQAYVQFSRALLDGLSRLFETLDRSEIQIDTTTSAQSGCEMYGSADDLLSRAFRGGDLP